MSAKEADVPAMNYYASFVIYLLLDLLHGYIEYSLRNKILIYHKKLVNVSPVLLIILASYFIPFIK